MEYVKVFLPATRKTRSLPGRATMRRAHPEKFSSLDLGAARASWEILFKLVSQWPGLFHPARRFPQNRPGSPPSKLFLRSFLLICSLSFSPAWPAVIRPSSPPRLFKTLSLIPAGAHCFSLSLLSCSIPFKESGMKHASETAFYLKKKKTNRRRNWSSTIIQRKKKEKHLSLLVILLFPRWYVNLFKFVRFKSEQRMFAKKRFRRCSFLFLDILDTYW